MPLYNTVPGVNRGVAVQEQGESGRWAAPGRRSQGQARGEELIWRPDTRAGGPRCAGRAFGRAAAAAAAAAPPHRRRRPPTPSLPTPCLPRHRTPGSICLFDDPRLRPERTGMYVEVKRCGGALAPPRPASAGAAPVSSTPRLGTAVSQGA